MMDEDVDKLYIIESPEFEKELKETNELLATKLELEVLVKGCTEFTQSMFFGFPLYEILNVDIPNGITTIDSYAFNITPNVRTIALPRTVIKIHKMAFLWCFSLESLTFKDRTLDEVRSIPGYPWNVSPEKIVVQG